MGNGSWRWDLVGLPWSEAQPILQARGLTYDTTVTAPPTRPIGLGELRVVAQRETTDGLLLVLAHREYVRSSTPEEPPKGESTPPDQGGL